MRTPLVLSLWLGVGLAQCPVTFPPPPSCDNCIPLVVQGNGQAVVPANTTRCVQAGDVVHVRNLEIKKEGVLIICGTLISEEGLDLSNGAQLWIAPGGSMHGAAGIGINASSSIYNYGLLTGQSLTLNGGGASFWNIGSGAQVQISGNIIVNASTQFINHAGQIQAGSLTLNGNGTACLSNLACISVGSFAANGNGSIQVTGTGPVALHFTNQAILNATITSSDQLLVCQAPGATVNNPANWGAAQVETNCTSGCGVLPAQQLQVHVRRQAETLRVAWNWKGVPSPVSSYTLEVYTATERKLLYVGLAEEVYLSESTLPVASEWIFQVVAWSATGERLTQGSSVLAAERAALRVWPTFFEDHLSYAGAPEKGMALLYDTQGRLLRQLPVEAESGSWWADSSGEALSTLSPGVYILVLPGSPGVRVIKR